MKLCRTLLCLRTGGDGWVVNIHLCVSVGIVVFVTTASPLEAPFGESGAKGQESRPPTPP